MPGRRDDIVMRPRLAASQRALHARPLETLRG